MFSRKHTAAATRPDFGGAFRALTKLRFAAVALAVLLPAAPSHAQTYAYVSATGSGNSCTATQPCATVSTALGVAISVRVVCLNGAAQDSVGLGITSPVFHDVDCPLGIMGSMTYGAGAVFSTVKMRHMGFPLITFQASGTLILEDCFSSGVVSTALDIEPNGPLELIIRNTRIADGGPGILLRPAAGGSIKATLDHVTITGNNGGGIKTDSSNGVIDLDITDSVISNNSGNGVNAVGGASNQNIVSIKNSIIARNGAAGLQANGANAGVLVATSLFDQNAAGATSIVSGGNIFTYGNNSVIGSLGAGFPVTAPMH